VDDQNAVSRQLTLLLCALLGRVTTGINAAAAIIDADTAHVPQQRLNHGLRCWRGSDDGLRFGMYRCTDLNDASPRSQQSYLQAKEQDRQQADRLPYSLHFTGRARRRRRPLQGRKMTMISVCFSMHSL